ncbi:uncharacterized protein LOC113272841 [Papaver somniferum]|uniref:uncharacterized protein LOC113272841 n=1 Tax=Papaver somniferum TaxID=3469 RepID=UPI000E7028CE|nr:uncharacterized protein LOC113272841 [Papaver somniferum]
MEKYFPASKAASVRKEISGILQMSVESLYEYWERYKGLLARCPQHNISSILIIQYFYEGLLPKHRNLINEAAGGSLTKKTISQATSLIESMASNAQQFHTRNKSNVRRVSEVGESAQSEQRMNNIEKVVQRMAAAIIPTYEEESEQVNVVFPNQRPSYANQQAATPNPYGRQSGFQQPQFRLQPPPQPQHQTQNSILKEMMKIMMQKQYANAQRQDAIMQKQDMTIKDLQLQMGQLDTDMNEINSLNSAKWPSQPFVNPRANVNVVTLRSGKQTEDLKQQ